MTQTVFNCGYKEDCAYYKKLNETLKELNDMAEFKNFGETIKDKEFIDNPVNAYEKLQQENAELKAYKDVNEDFKTAWEELKAENKKLLHQKNTMTARYTITYTTLQEIKDYLNTLSGIDNDFVNTETYLRILDIITKAEVSE